MSGIPDLKILTEFENKVAVVIGTRPGLVMFSPIIRELLRRQLPFFMVHAGQHYSSNMDAQLFDDLQLPEPDYRFESVAAAKFHGAQTGEMLRQCEEVFLAERPALVLVGGDSNCNLAGALAARKLHVQVGHVEAGERSYDWRMPEEHNRIVIDHISEYLFTTSEKGAANLRSDSVRGHVLVTGNPIVDSTQENLALAAHHSELLAELGIDRSGYFLMTVHREENVDSEEALREILEGVRLIAQACEEPVVFVVHPRTQKRLEQFELLAFADSIDGLIMIEAQSYLPFLALSCNASLILTDSGGVQQEACILRVPCVTLRDTTEWTESVERGANLVAGTSPDAILEAVHTMRDVERIWDNPFGDGKASVRIVDAVAEALDPATRWGGPEAADSAPEIALASTARFEEGAG